MLLQQWLACCACEGEPNQGGQLLGGVRSMLWAGRHPQLSSYASALDCGCCEGYWYMNYSMHRCLCKRADVWKFFGPLAAALSTSLLIFVFQILARVHCMKLLVLPRAVGGWKPECSCVHFAPELLHCRPPPQQHSLCGAFEPLIKTQCTYRCWRHQRGLV